VHDDAQLPRAQASTVEWVASTQPQMSQASGPVPLVGEDGMIQDRRQAVTQPVPASRIVPKPVPQSQSLDPREFQLGQIRRRFSPKETTNGGVTLLRFSLAPSDPDFPFEMAALECLLSVPSTYPNNKASLKVGNKDIPRGFALNVEYGFEGLVKERPETTLLELMKALDKNLETFLSAPKMDTVKLVPNKDTRHLSTQPSRSVEPAVVTSKATTSATDTLKPSVVKSAETFTAQQKAEAMKSREAETRQLEARMGRLPLYKKSEDGIAYTLPIEPRRRADLPIALQAVKTVQLFVPNLYPLQPCRIQLDGVEPKDSKPVEAGFEKRSIEQKEVTLMGHVNYLAQNLHLLAKTPIEQKKAAPPAQQGLVSKIDLPTTEPGTEGKQLEGLQDPERSHVQYISRPPEWTVVDPEEASDYDSDVYSYDSEETTDEDGGVEDGGVEVKPDETQQSSQPAQNPERGTAISFPFIELYGIELLEVVTLNITVKCERCKETTEVKGLKDGATKSESCKKCASPLSIGFRRDLVHAHAVRAGFLDLDGCIVGDMLPRYVHLILWDISMIH
jgi:hypothetical protein